MARTGNSRARRPQPGSVIFGAKLTIDRLGQRGEGVALHAGKPVFVPHALPGETVLADIDGDRGALNNVEQASHHRVAPLCPHYGTCGGCAMQVLADEHYLAWKRDLLCAALAREKINAPVGDIIAAHGQGRRRVTFHARYHAGAQAEHKVELGFMRARSHELVAIDACPVLSPALAGAAVAGQRIARVLAVMAKPLDLVITATQSGLDVDLRGAGPLPNPVRLALARLAEALDLARLSNHGEIIIERHAPQLAIGAAMLNPPPGAFLQATLAGEETLGRLVLEAAAGSKQITDLFAGVGTFALRLAEVAPVMAMESDKAALQALARAANFAKGHKGVATQERDLFRRPLADKELQTYDCVVMDPPRAGAQEQAAALAKSNVAKVISVSCNTQTFARDARILVDGGYALDQVTPVDQFIYSPHVEIFGVFKKSAAKKQRRRLLG